MMDTEEEFRKLRADLAEGFRQLSEVRDREIQRIQRNLLTGQWIIMGVIVALFGAVLVAAIADIFAGRWP